MSFRMPLAVLPGGAAFASHLDALASAFAEGERISALAESVDARRVVIENELRRVVGALYDGTDVVAPAPERVEWQRILEDVAQSSAYLVAGLRALASGDDDLGVPLRALCGSLAAYLSASADALRGNEAPLAGRTADAVESVQEAMRRWRRQLHRSSEDTANERLARFRAAERWERAIDCIDDALRRLERLVEPGPDVLASFLPDAARETAVPVPFREVPSLAAVPVAGNGPP
jgi:hypothetical protein